LCKAALGYSFAGGTTDGPGAFDFNQGDTDGNAFLDFIKDFLINATAELKECQQ
jgi:neutral ceramidase